MTFVTNHILCLKTWDFIINVWEFIIQTSIYRIIGKWSIHHYKVPYVCCHVEKKYNPAVPGVLTTPIFLNRKKDGYCWWLILGAVRVSLRTTSLPLAISRTRDQVVPCNHSLREHGWWMPFMKYAVDSPCFENCIITLNISKPKHMYYKRCEVY